jgi:CheY-like chemotaxis protein
MQELLIVDDDPHVRDSIRDVLSATGGYQIAAANDGSQALSILEKRAFDVVLLDLFMPNIDGLELIAELRTRWPKTRIVAMSGGGAHHMSNLLRVAENLGAHGTLQKPFDTEQLLNRLSGSANTTPG